MAYQTCSASTGHHIAWADDFLDEKVALAFIPLAENTPISVEPDRAEDEVFAILDDEYARTILTATSLEPMSAKDLSEQYGMSLPTISRRVNTLLDHDLLVERTQLDPDGHHYSEYEARLDRITVKLLDGALEVEVTVQEDPADRFTRIWREIRND